MFTRSKSIWLGAIVGAVAMMTAASAAITAAKAAEKTLLRLSTHVNKVDARYKGLEVFAKVVNEKTNGRVEVQIFGSNTLHPFAQAIDGVLGGVSDISVLGSAAFDKRVPCGRVTHMLPIPIDWDRHVELDSQVNELLSEEMGKIGLIPVMGSNSAYAFDWWFREPPPKRLDQLTGKLIRSPGGVVTHVIEKWGGKPVYISPKEAYLAAERGVVDGIAMSAATFSSWKLWDVMPYMVRAQLFYANVMYVMNKKKFDALSPEDRNAIIEAGVEAERWLKPVTEDAIDGEVGKAVMRGGASVMRVSNKERARLSKSAGEGWVDKLDEHCGPDLAERIRALFARYAP